MAAAVKQAGVVVQDTLHLDALQLVVIKLAQGVRQLIAPHIVIVFNQLELFDQLLQQQLKIASADLLIVLLEEFFFFRHREHANAFEDAVQAAVRALEGFIKMLHDVIAQTVDILRHIFHQALHLGVGVMFRSQPIAEQQHQQGISQHLLCHASCHQFRQIQVPLVAQ